MGILWDGTSVNFYVMGQTNMSHGQSCKNTYSTPSKWCTTRFLQEATQHQNRWPPRSYKKLSPRTKNLLKCTSGVQYPHFGVQYGLILGFFWIWIGLDIVSSSTGSGTGLSKWNKLGT